MSSAKAETERAREFGRQASRNQRKRDENPYRRSSALRHLADAWEQGFNEARPERTR